MRRNLFDENEIKVPVHSVLYLLVKEILSPFYVFQVTARIMILIKLAKFGLFAHGAINALIR